MCETPEELMGSGKFRTILVKCLSQLSVRNSPLLQVFEGGKADEEAIDDFIKTLSLLVKNESQIVPHIFSRSSVFLREKYLLNNLVEYIYDYWRHF